MLSKKWPIANIHPNTKISTLQLNKNNEDMKLINAWCQMKLLSTKLLSKIYYPNFAKYYDYMTMTNTQILLFYYFNQTLIYFLTLKFHILIQVCKIHHITNSISLN